MIYLDHHAASPPSERVRETMVEARRVAPPSGRSLDVDVVFDLMIHDLDLVLGWMEPAAEMWFSFTRIASNNPTR